MLRRPTPVGMQVSFGKDKYYWSNVYPTQLSRSFEKDIKKFGRVLKVIKRVCTCSQSRGTSS